MTAVGTQRRIRSYSPDRRFQGGAEVRGHIALTVSVEIDALADIDPSLNDARLNRYDALAVLAQQREKQAWMAMAAVLKKIL